MHQDLSAAATDTGQPRKIAHRVDVTAQARLARLEKTQSCALATVFPIAPLTGASPRNRLCRDAHPTCGAAGAATSVLE